jgi:hypothetical protein
MTAPHAMSFAPPVSVAQAAFAVDSLDMRTRALALTVLAVLGGCSRSAAVDDCPTVIRTRAATMRELTAAAGQPSLPQAAVDEMVAACPATRAAADEPNPMLECLLAAADRDTVKYCWDWVLAVRSQPPGGSGSGGGSGR